MRTAWTIGAAAVLLSQSLFPLIAQAASFPDVPASNPYAVAIGALSDKHVINGNPDGTFAPDRSVNRAEFLTMLYRSKSMNPAAPTSACFTDVPPSAWFAPVVCDAATKTYVSGYSDKTFKPEQAVNRVEALKMMFTVLGLSQQTTVDATTKALGYSDISASAWYMQYLSAAFKLNILPVPGVSSTTFGPDQPLTRAEAAAYIYNAISPSPLSLTPSASSSSSSAMSSSASSQSVMMRSSSSKSVAPDNTLQPVTTQVTFPFGDNGTFTSKATRSYVFTLTQRTTLSAQVTVANNNTPDDVTCRLYKLDAVNSFSLEYYLGYQSADSCILRVTLLPGSYQMDVTPRVTNAPFTLLTKTVASDGNDGFAEAKSLTMGTPASALLDTNDFGDYYTFKLSADTNMTIQVSNAAGMRCVIYPMEDVDIYGFAEPDCNQLYDFPQGTYYVGILQKDDRATKQSYSIQYTK